MTNKNWFKVSYLNKLPNKDVQDFYKFEGKLATEPIVTFIEKELPSTNGLLVDFGCGNKTYIKFIPQTAQYIGIDLKNKTGVISENIKKTSLDPDSVDFALCNQVIEHDPEPDNVVKEIYRVLKRGGVLFLTAPQMGRLHGEPYDYYRFTKWGIKHILEEAGFKIVFIESHGGFFRAIGSHINFFLAEKGFKSKVLRFILRTFVIRLNNIFFSILDHSIQFEKDTLGYNVKAIKE